MNPVGLTVLVLVLVAATAFGLRRLRTNGVLRSTSDGAGEPLTEGELGAPLGSAATFVQFSSAFCQPCRATRRLLDEVVGALPDVRHIEVDAESHLNLVRRLDILRTPTVLVLDASGREIQRASGQPRKADLVAALGRVR